MFGLSQLEERLAWAAIVVLIVFGFAWHEQSVGARSCELADAKVAAIQKAAAAAQEATDAQRLRSAQDAYQAEIARLSQPQPATHVVCKSAGAKPVPKATGVPAAQSPGAGTLPSEGSRDFDPGPALDALHDEADLIVAQCRKLDAAVPH